MKKILFYISTFPTFSENFITREIEALVKSGKLDIKILSLGKGSRAELPEALKSKTIYYSKTKVQRLLNISSILKIFLRNPFNFFKTWFKYFDRPLSFGTALSLIEIVDDFKPELILGNWLTEGALMSNILSDLSGVPFVIEAHANDIWTTPVDVIKRRISDAKFVVTCTSNNASFLKKIVNEKDKNKINTVYHFLDSNIFEGKTTTFNDVPVLFAMGRKVEKKGFIYLIRAARILKDKGYNFIVNFAGADGPESSNLKSEVEKLKLEDTVKFLSEVTFSEFKHRFLESDIVVAPSVKSKEGDMDGVPNVTIEGLFAGVPSVSSDISAISEVIKDNITGFLAKDGDEKDLAEKLEILISDKNKRIELGTSGRKFIIEMFSFENTAGKLESLLLS